jgi:hypothetical protein
MNSYTFWGTKQAANSTCLLHADFLFGLLFDPEDGDDMFLRNIG